MSDIHSVLFELEVITKDAEAFFSRHVELPFVPVGGMQFMFSPDDYSYEIGRSLYRVDEGQFEVMATIELGGDCCCTGDNCCILQTDEFIELGWKLENVRRGFERLRFREWMFDPDKWIRTRPDASLRRTT